MNIERLSLDQMRIFAMVAESGSFSATAKALGRAQSAVSYAITTLEQQLGVVVFDRTAYRPKLTQVGTSILSDVQVILAKTDALQARVRSLSAGLEPELGISVDLMFPMAQLCRMLNAFKQQFPSVTIRLFVETLGAVAEQVLSGAVHVGIIGTLLTIPKGLKTLALPPILLVPVAAPIHPLSQLEGRITQEQLQEHVQLVLTDRSQHTEGKEYGVYSGHSWRLSDLSTKHALLIAGMGFGNMPLHMVQNDLEQGRLVQLPLEIFPKEGMPLPMHAIYRQDAPIGSAQAWLLERLNAL